MKAWGSAGYFRSGLPYNCSGHGPATLIVFQGLLFENKPLTGLLARSMLAMYRFLEDDYTVFFVIRRPGLPIGYSMKDMSDDYARMIKEEFGGPVDVIGTSTGGSIAQHFGADHPDLVRRLVLHSTAHTLGEAARKAQLRAAHLAKEGRWRGAYAEFLRYAARPSWLAPGITWFGSLLMSLNAPEDPSDLVVTVEAEDKHSFKERLSEITAPTLVVAGDRDAYYPEELVRETAEGIPNARLILYEGMGHPASGKRFARDVLRFLKEDPPGNPI